MNRVVVWSRLKRLILPRTLRSLEAYALWAPSYPPYAHNGLMEIEQAAMLRLMPTLIDRVVLDLACGTGRYGRIATQSGAAQVVGVDNSVPMLEAGGNSTAFSVLAPMSRLPFRSGSFDVILCGLATGHLPPETMGQAIIEIGRVLRPGGEALISDFHPLLYAQGGRRTFTAPDGRSYAVEHYPHSLDDYRTAISAAGMIVIAVEEPDAEVNGSRLPAVLAIRCQRV